MIDHRTGMLRIESVLDCADTIDWEEGLVAYERYRQTMQRFADYYKFSLEQVTATFCALLPNNDYKGNLKSMVTVLHGINNDWNPEEITVTTYNACKNRAYNFASGLDFLSVTKGPKTRAFYQNIIHPEDPTPVTVDGHMMGIWANKRMTMVEAIYERIPYEDVAHGIRCCAFSRMIRGNQAQAILWFAWKRIHNVVYSPQLNMFQYGDNWGTDVQPSTVTPFPRRPYDGQHNNPPRSLASTKRRWRTTPKQIATERVGH